MCIGPARPRERGLKPECGAGSAGAAALSAVALILVRRNSASGSGYAAGSVLCQSRGVHADSADGGPVPSALRAVLDDEAHGVDVDLVLGQLFAEGGDDRLGGLLGCAIAERDVGRPG